MSHLARVMRRTRSFFYVPGSSDKMLSKATGLGVDAVVLDLEDGVAPSQKEQARTKVIHALQSLDFGRSARLVRINPPSVPDLYHKDLQAVCEAPTLPDAVVLPKVEGVAQLDALAARLGLGSDGKPVPLVAMVESARSLVNLGDIARHPSLRALVFGADDYAADVGAGRSRDGEEVFFARNMVLLHASANNLLAIDMVHIDLTDETHFLEECQRGFRMGFAGKQLIHPKQIAPAHQAFSPPADKVAWAQRVLDAYKTSEEKGKGAFVVDGAMIDMPTVKQAQRILNMADP